MTATNLLVDKKNGLLQKSKGGQINKRSLFLLLTINIFLFSSLILHWHTSREIKNNFTDFSQQVNGELKNFSKIVNQVEEGLGGIQKEIKGLTKTIEELNAIERELKNITTNLAELNKTGQELEKTGENIKSSLDDLGELKEKIDELTKLEIPLIELEKSLIKGGEGLEKEIKEKIGGLVSTIKDFKKIVCPSCFNWNSKSVLFSSINNNVLEEGKWKRLFEDGKLTISGKVETVNYSQSWWKLNGLLDRKVINEEMQKDITIEQKSEIKSWKDKEEQRKDGEGRKEFMLQTACCRDCGRKLDLKNFSIKKLREGN